MSFLWLGFYFVLCVSRDVTQTINIKQQSFVEMTGVSRDKNTRDKHR